VGDPHAATTSPIQSSEMKRPQALGATLGRRGEWDTAPSAEK
jgi:hypothetical protein